MACALGKCTHNKITIMLPAELPLFMLPVFYNARIFKTKQNVCVSLDNKSRLVNK